MTGLLTAAPTGPAVSVPPTHADTLGALKEIGHAPAGYTLGGPHVVLTASGVTLVAWRQYGKTPNAIRLVRQTATTFKPVSIRRGPLTELGEPYLTEDLVNHRLLMSAFGQSDGAANLGLYVWTSTDDGATWSAPKRVWDSFATGQIALDSKGGFYAITDLTEVSVTHVPKSLTMQEWPADDIPLSDRISSRGEVGLATVGADHVLLFAFANSAGDTWLHIGTKFGRRFDTPFDVGGFGDFEIASNQRGVVVSFLSPGPHETKRIDTATVEELGSGRLAIHQAEGPVGDVTWFSVGALPDAAKQPAWQFQLAWLEADGRLRTTQTVSSDDGTLTWKVPPSTLVRFPTGAYQFPGPIAVSVPWVISHAYDSDLTEVQVAVPR